MNKFYFIVFLIGFTFMAGAQEPKTDSNYPSDIIKARVLKFYPNPASSVINFEILKPVQRDLTLQVYNFIGKKVFEQNGINQKTTIALNDFYRGVYIFQLRDKTGRIVESGKFQVNK
jgi:hypothetical protein